MPLPWVTGSAGGSSPVRSLWRAVRGSLPVKPVPPAGGSLLDRGAALAGAGAWECDLSTNALTWTDGVFDIFGLPRGAKICREGTLALYSEESRAEVERLRADALERRQSFTLDAKILRLDGEQRWMRLTGAVVCRAGRPTHLYGLKQDITPERQALEALRRVAENDAITGLASRGVFQDRFLNASAAERAAFPVCALVLFDMDGFKQINDTNGHPAGDACLQAVANRLADCFPDAAMIARIGGDEFALLLRDLPADMLAQRVAAFLPQVTHRIYWNGQILHVSASAGIATAPDQRSYDPGRMFAAADAALYHAKRSGRNRMHLAAV